MSNRLRVVIAGLVIGVVVGLFANRFVHPAEPQPDFRSSVLNASEDEVRQRLGEPLLCVDQGDGKRALAYGAVNVGREVKPVVVYLSEDRAVSVTSRGVELP